MKQSLISELEGFIGFVKTLDALSDEIWDAPLSKGKWSIHDMITHIMRWDEYFNNFTFPMLTETELSELREHPDYLAFNEQSIRYGKGRTKNEIIEEAIRNRQLMVSNLSKLEDSKFSVVYPGDRGFTIESYLTEFFVSHDKHHMEQIQAYLMKK
ncbi:DinB family protein [Paenibacillus aceti]|uniref:DinB-like domain-containing protein n=1 Tax=Paenibacillus aceti TaxID=1820010 RepID=A0ABQ1VRU8_9BACL|nr:DinB family protein [Paenibacillus aceti]GGF92640.1 hypothetical protein GCM10010913_12750 [Paenibacillus aceti]